MELRNFIRYSLSGATALAAQEVIAGNSSQRIVPYINHGRWDRQAPFGGDVPASISYYNRVSPYIANAGLSVDDGLARL